MLIKAKEVVLKNGISVILKSPECDDAQALIDHMKLTSLETHYMARYPEEIILTEKQEKKYIQECLKDQNAFMLAAYIDGKLIGNVSLNSIQPLIKMRHRAVFGISIINQYCHMGLGTIMLKEVLSIAKTTHYQQIELDVFSDNITAIHVYQKIGFQEVGRIPNAFQLKDGTCYDAIQMVYNFHDK